MTHIISQLCKLDWFDKLKNMFLGLFAIIPQFIYFLYASCASLLDALQYLIRKLAGLDVYYINGEAQHGDIVISFIRGILGIDKSASYSPLKTVFWSLVIFGCILLVLTTIFSIIKAHYNYDAKKSNPFTIIGQSLKSLALMAIVPITAVFGLYLSQIILQSLDTITSSSTAGQEVFTIKDDDGNVISSIADLFEGDYLENVDGSKSAIKSYASYDFFTAVAYTNNTTFSGVMFKTAAYNCNRVRSGTYSPASQKSWSKWTNFGVFYSNANGTALKDNVADQIDYAFQNALTLKEDLRGDVGLLPWAKDKNWDYLEKSGKEDTSLLTAYFYGFGALNLIGLNDVAVFSKFNVGLVYYYYDLWGFNYFLGFAGIIAFILILGNVVFGLMTRLIQLVVLFFVFPPLIGIAPLDDGNAFKAWRKQFISDVLMAYGAIVGMNLFLLILPFLNTISFFNIAVLDRIMNIFLMLAGLTMVKNLIKMISTFIGGSDANASGEETRKAVGDVGGKALATTVKAANVGLKVGKGAFGLMGAAGRGVASATGAAGRGIVSAHYTNKAKRALVQEGMASGLSKSDAKFAVSLDKEGVAKKAADLREDRAAEKQVNKEDRAARMQNFKENTKFGRGLVKTGRGFAKGAAVTAATLFGGDIQRKEDGTIDSGATFKATGKGVINLAGAAIKLAGGDILRGSAVTKKAEETGVTDALKTLTRDAMGKHLGSSVGKLQTKKEKEGQEKAAASAQQKSQSEVASNTEQSLAELRKISDLLSKKP